MDLFNASRTLLRSSQSLLTRPRRTAPLRKSQLLRCPPSRPFTSSHAKRQQSAARREEDSEPANTSTTTNTTSAADEFSALLDGALSTDKGTPTAPTTRTSRFKTPSSQQYASPARNLAANQARTAASTSSSSEQMGSAIDELMSTITAPRPNLQTRNPSARSNNMHSAFASILDGIGTSSLNAPSKGPAPPPPPQQAPMKLNSSTGRTVQVDSLRGMDVARAFRMLEVQCARNSVRKDERRQRFHERPGLKRKRLASERWRRRFKEEFRRTVGMVMGLKKQGW